MSKQPNDIRPSNIRKLALIFIGLLMVVPLIGLAIVKLYGPQIEREAYENLGAVARLKAEQIETLLGERNSDGTVLMSDAPFGALVNQFLNQQHDVSLSNTILERLGSLRKAYDYESIMLLDTSGRLLLMQGNDAEMLPSLKEKLQLAINSKTVQRGNLFRDTSGHIHMDWVVPIIASSSKGEYAVAAVVMRITANRNLFPLIQTWPTASPSAETLLVRRENDSVTYLNELRHRTNTALTMWRSLYTPDLPAAIALRTGGIGTTSGKDHLSVPVLAAYRPVDGTDWVIVAKIDRDEILTPLHELVLWVSLIAFFAVITLSFLILSLWRQHQHTQHMVLMSEKTKADHLLQQFFHLSIIGMAIIDPASKRWIRFNNRLCDILGYSHEELAKLTWVELTHPDDLVINIAEYEKVLLGESDGYSLKKRFIRKDGSVVHTLVDIKSIQDEDNNVKDIVATIEDVTERDRAEEELRIAAIAIETQEGILITDAHERILRINRAFTQITGYTQEECIGKTPRMLSSGRHDTEFYKEVWETVRQVGSWQGELWNRRKNGSEYPEWLTITAVRAPDGIITHYIGSMIDITRRKQLDEELVQMHDRALESVKLKSQFLSNMSHEIRTPMNGVIGMADLLLDTTLDAQQLEFTRIIRESGQALLTIINDILDLSKIEAGKLEIDHIDFQLRHVVEGSLDIVTSRAHEKHLALSGYIDPAIPAVLIGDPGRLRQILINLIGNAIKFTESGEVAVRVMQCAGDERLSLLRFEIQDTGIGMSKEVSSKLFQPFTQADGSVTRRYGGTGLGLSISKQLVELMNGQMGVSSEVGRGSTFWFELALETGAVKESESYPVGFGGQTAMIITSHSFVSQTLSGYLKAWGMTVEAFTNAEDALHKARLDKNFNLAIVSKDLPGTSIPEFSVTLSMLVPGVKLILFSCEAEDRGKLSSQGFHEHLLCPVKQSTLRSTLMAIQNGAKLPVQHQLNQSVPSTTPSKNNRSTQIAPCTILLVEDNVVNQKVAIRLLQKLGYISHVVENGALAVEAVKTGNYGLILMDCQMPVMDGFEATATIRLREHYTGVHTPIIAMTANAMQGDRERCHEVGMDDYLTKPINFEELKKTIERWLPKCIEPFNSSTAESTQEYRNSVIDMERLQDVFGEDIEVVDELFQVFTKTTHDLLNNLKKAAEQTDFKAIKSIGHQISGSAANLGLLEIERLGRSIEHAANVEEANQVSKLHSELEEAIYRLEELVKGGISQWLQ